jgi:Lon protease-like protein
LQLPCGEVIVVKLELLSNGIAGIRLRGFKRIKVSEELLVPTNLTHCTLPDWLPVNVPKESILDVLLSYKKAA